MPQDKQRLEPERPQGEGLGGRERKRERGIVHSSTKTLVWLLIKNNCR